MSTKSLVLPMQQQCSLCQLSRPRKCSHRHFLSLMPSQVPSPHPGVTLAFLHIHMAGVDSPKPLPLSQNGLQSRAGNRFDPAFDTGNHTVSFSIHCPWAPKERLSLAFRLLSSVTFSNRIALSCSFATTQSPCTVPAQPFVQPLRKPFRQIDPVGKTIFWEEKTQHVFLGQIATLT